MVYFSKNGKSQFCVIYNGPAIFFLRYKLILKFCIKEKNRIT